jgi:mannose-1-phosphate guanylyltransferase/mannose-6-phosphate isomerase
MAVIQPVILCGGSGTRLWPLSRAGFPKQFLCLTGEQSLFQLAVGRLQALPGAAAPLIVGNEDHRFLALEQLREMGIAKATLLLEPVGRNTAPALTLAALAARAGDDDPVLVVTPADQTVSDSPAFFAALGAAVAEAQTGAVVIVGITPTAPETGYGYIKATGTAAVKTVERFVEKPARATAEAYLAEGGYYWNGGMFVLKASAWLAALERHRPDVATATHRAWASAQTDASTGFVRPDKAAFEAVPAVSVDYAVLEKLPADTQAALRMVPLDAGWNDLGAWDAVWQASPKNEQGNATQGDALLADSNNCYVHGSHRMVAVAGLDDVMVVETADAVLVTHRSRAQEVKSIVAELQRQGREELSLHRKVSRPWGWYDSIDEGGRFKVKRICVNPGASLNLQMHYHRAEHWVVVSGTAQITNGEQVIVLSENESTYIPLGQTHRLANPGTIPLEIIEVQSGSYLGEDDIVRFEDTYGRTQA